ncbi:vascular endothelial growth factor receptor kdr-like, partial [Diprion similis]|uniref:vascular endothelial growth factor receptor kdr-like n=1 Tax=Diprion similis TaxID=362088 RepID=UPI001EF86236
TDVMAGNRRALLVMIVLLSGCLVFADAVSENEGEVIVDAEWIFTRVGNPAILICDVLGSVSDYGWRKNWGYPGIEENLRNLTDTWRFNETHLRTSVYFTNILKRDLGAYECWARDHRNKNIRKHSVILSSSFKSLTVLSIVGLGANRICIPLRFAPNFYDKRISELRIQSLENGSREWQLVSKTSRNSSDLQHASISRGYKRNTTYWFKFTWREENRKEAEKANLFLRWTTTPEEDPVYVPRVWGKETTNDSITIEWSTPPPEIQSCFTYYQLTMWYSVIYEEIYSVPMLNTQYKFESLTTAISHKFRLVLCIDDECKNILYTGPWSEDIMPKDRDPKFTPKVSVIETGVDSISIAWNAPPVDLQDGIYYYKLALSNTHFENPPLYLNKTDNSYTFKNLLLNTTYLLKVAACSEFKTQCGNWSEELKASTYITDSRNGAQDEILLITGAIAIPLVIVVATVLACKIRRKALKRKSIKARLEYFKFGAPISLDPDLAVSDQAELLPYNKKWEFPRSLLKLEDVLGSGAFGVVRMGQAKTICSRETVTTVAVKTVRPTANLICMKALYRELRILVYLGQHLNIVNLLGACTKNIDLGELLVIVEYCRYGNLHDYLIRRRVNFVNQLNNSGEKIHVSTAREDEVNVDDVETNTDGHSDGILTTENNAKNITSTTTDVRADDCSSSDISRELTPPLKYPGDQTDFNSRQMCTGDLVCWAWQVSCGMQYLSAKRIIHGDLATRNILLTDNNVAKICDFGLSKSLREEENQKNTESCPLPVKWMAIESLRDRVFSTKSDVWSFGVVLWELFSLARTPYPLIRPEDMCQRLTEGYRMDKPQYAPASIYQMMLRCWKVEPSERPSFEKLTVDISELIEEHVKTYYMELGNPYTKIYADIWKRERETAKGTEESSTLEEN